MLGVLKAKQDKVCTPRNCPLLGNALSGTRMFQIRLEEFKKHLRSY